MYMQAFHSGWACPRTFAFVSVQTESCYLNMMHTVCNHAISHFEAERQSVLLAWRSKAEAVELRVCLCVHTCVLACTCGLYWPAGLVGAPSV